MPHALTNCLLASRWKTIQIQNAVFVVGAIVIAAASSVDDLYVGRFIVGTASALSAIADLPYLTEISPPLLRGRLTSAYEMLVVVGILFSFIMNLALVEVDGGWRWMFGLPAIFAGMQSLLMLSLPESPKWLLEKGDMQGARQVLYMSTDCDADVDLILEEFRAQMDVGFIEMSTVEEGSSRGGENIAIIKTSDCSIGGAADAKLISRESKVLAEYRPAFFCILALMFFQQFTGGVVIRNYATEIFEDAGFSEHNALVFTILLGIVKVLITAWTIYEVSCSELSHDCPHRFIAVASGRLHGSPPTASVGNRNDRCGTTAARDWLCRRT